MTWEEINGKYPMDREDMNLETELQFVSDCFDAYEEEGFAETFWSPYSSHEDKIGKRFSVVRRYEYPNDIENLEALPMWLIKIESTDEEFPAFPEEVIKSEQDEQKIVF